MNFLTDYTGDPELLTELAKSSPDIKVSEALDIGFRFIASNKRRPPFNDAAFRRALSAAIDRELMAAEACGGAAVPANSWVSPALAFWHARASSTVPGGTLAAQEDAEGRRLRAGRRQAALPGGQEGDHAGLFQ